MTSSAAISDVASRIDAIQQQLQQLQSGTLLDSLLNISPGSSTGATSGTDFSDALAQAQATEPTSSADGVGQSSLAASALGSSLDTGSLGALTGGTGVSGGVALPQRADSMLTSSQRQFASTLSADTGLNPGVVSAWMLAEESGGAAQSRQSAGNNDWLNIGYTDSATYGSSDSVWSSPASAANATAQWLKGHDSIPGYGTASSGIQAILQTVGQSPSAQISALQNSGWASSGYPDLGSLYAQVTGS
jgi:hypothetical protein